MIIQVRGKKYKIPDHKDVSIKQLEQIAKGKEPCYVLIKNLTSVNENEQALLNELVKYLLEIPEAYTNKWILEDQLLNFAASLNINVFEGIRAEIGRRGEQTALAIPYIFQALKLPRKLRKYHYEIGLKVYVSVGLFLEHWSNYGVFDEPSEQEQDAAEEAGVHLLQSFGAYSVIQSVAERYGVLPQEVEKYTAGWVYKDYVFNFVKNEYRDNFQKIMQRKKS